MKEHEVELIVQSVTHTVISALQPQLDGIQAALSVLRTSLERLERDLRILRGVARATPQQVDKHSEVDWLILKDLMAKLPTTSLEHRDIIAALQYIPHVMKAMDERLSGLEIKEG